MKKIKGVENNGYFLVFKEGDSRSAEKLMTVWNNMKVALKQIETCKNVKQAKAIALEVLKQV